MILPLIILYTNGCIAPPLRQETVHSLVALVGIAAAVAVNALNPTEAALVLCLALATALFSLLSCYWMEAAQRRAYLLTLRERLRSEQLALSNRSLEHQSSTAPLTGVANRRALTRALAQPYTGQRALLLLDVDHFKAFNDSYGHLAGDRCLQEIVQALAGQLEDGDCLARYGGEEFVVLLHDRDEAQSRAVAQGLLDTVRALAIKHRSAPGPQPWIRISTGGVQVDKGCWQGETLPEAADQQLYLAKRSGRDRARLERLLPSQTLPDMASTH